MENLRKRLETFFNTDNVEITPIVGGASVRNYYKIRLEEKLYFPSSELVLMVVPLQNIDMMLDFVHVQHYLSHMKIPTPRLYEMQKENGWLFLEYIEDPLLMDYLQANPDEGKSILPEAIRFLGEMQRKCKPVNNCPAFNRYFDFEKYMFEFKFHVQEQLFEFYFGLKLAGDSLELFLEFAREISRTLNTEEKVFVHRDFQSSNIFYAPGKNNSQFRVIDFQDARTGTPVYDLVACLWDSYIDVEDSLREEIVEEFFKNLSTLSIPWDWDYYRKLIDYSIIQRKLHDAGAFAYNYRRTNSNHFLPYIFPAIDMATVRIQAYPRFSKVLEIFETLKEKEN